MVITGIDKMVQDRKITEIVHFTSNRGLVGCLDKGFVLSTRRLPDEDRLTFVFQQTALERQEGRPNFNKDKDWIDYISMSVSEINAHYFKYARKWHVADEDLFWIILSFAAEIMTHKGVYFTTTNNTYSNFVRRDPGSEGLEALFAPTVKRKEASWIVARGDRAPHLPTCQQAEVLYPSALPIKFLQKIYVSTGAESDMVASCLELYDASTVEVVVDVKKFRGAPN